MNGLLFFVLSPMKQKINTDCCFCVALPKMLLHQEVNERIKSNKTKENN